MRAPANIADISSKLQTRLMSTIATFTKCSRLTLDTTSICKKNDRILAKKIHDILIRWQQVQRWKLEYIRKWAGEMLFTMNTTNETTDGWDRIKERVLKIALCTLKINYTPNQRWNISSFCIAWIKRNWDLAKLGFATCNNGRNSFLVMAILSKEKTQELRTNLVRRNLASGLTVGAANGGVLANFL